MLRRLCVRQFATGTTRGFGTAAAQAEDLSEKLRGRRKLKDPITVTDSASDRIRELLSKNPDAIAVRLGVKRRGCNGLSYTLNYATEFNKFEDKVQHNGVTVVIEPKALMHLIGTTMDYVEDELSSEFRFENPNSKGSCGCGESFNTDISS